MDKKTKREKTEKSDAIPYREFNRLIKGGAVPYPQEDSPGDSADDEVREYSLGKDYPEAPCEGVVVPADTPSGSEHEELDLDDTEERIRDPYGVQSSSRPNPEADMDDESSSTH